jgi:antirestriction protein ArdC
MKLSEKAQTALDKVIRQFEEGDLSDMVQALAILPSPGAPCYSWTFSNRTLLAAQKYTVDGRGFNQWREVGRKVKKGATAGYIFAPFMRGTDTVGQDGNKVYELKGWHTVAVFAAHDTEPIDPEAQDTLSYAPVQMPPLYEVAQRLGVSVEYAPHGGKANGWYEAGKEEIVLQVTTNRTFWHELAHAAHRHADIVDFLPQDARGETRAYHEAVAELTAAVLGEMYGEPCVGTSYRYLTKYYADPLFGIMQALRVVGKVLEVITGLAEGEGEEAVEVGEASKEETHAGGEGALAA